MSWSEVKKINDDLNTPLDVLATINHIDLVGSNWISRYDLNKTKKLFNTDAFWTHEIAMDIVCSDFWDYILKVTSGVGTILTNFFNLNIAGLTSWNTMAQIYSNNLADDLFANYLVGKSALFTNSAIQNQLLSNGAVSGYKGNADLMNLVYSNSATIDLIRNNTVGYANLIANAAVYTTVGAGTYTVTNEKWIIPLVVSGGGNGANKPITAAAHVGGRGGEYKDNFLYVNAGNTFSYTVGGANANSVFGTITCSTANGTAPTTTPSSSGKFLKASTNGGSAIYNQPGGGGGGYGGGNGGYTQVDTSSCTSYSVNTVGGGTGAGTFTGGTGGAVGASYSTYSTATAGVNGGGGAGGVTGSYSNQGSGGGGGYGGGGGAGGVGNNATQASNGGTGGQGIVVVLRK